MAINFPDSPSNGDTHIVGDKTWTYNASKTRWTASGLYVSDNAPTSPSAGDQWFNSTDGSLLVYYNDGSSSQWVVVSGPAGSDGAAGASSTPTSYANLAAFPSSGNTAGDFGFATDTKAVYVWDGTEWDRVYTDANAVPEWTTAPPSTATLSIDGTATNQTVVASDPEGFPIEYSYDINPSNQSQATISQSSNAFTITPSTTEADAGSFTLRYKATDGLHSTSKSTIYTLEFSRAIDVSTAGSGSRMTINANSTTGALSLSSITGSSETLGVAYAPTTALKLGKQYIELNTTSSLQSSGDRFLFGIGDLAMAQAGTLGWNTLNNVQVSMYAETNRFYPYDGTAANYPLLDDGNLHTIMIAYDTTAGRAWFGVDGIWDTSSNTGGAPNTGAGIDISGINYTTGHTFIFGSTSASESATLQFVSGPSLNLTYTVPTGFNAY